MNDNIDSYHFRMQSANMLLELLVLPEKRASLKPDILLPTIKTAEKAVEKFVEFQQGLQKRLEEDMQNEGS